MFAVPERQNSEDCLPLRDGDLRAEQVGIVVALSHVSDSNVGCGGCSCVPDATVIAIAAGIPEHVIVGDVNRLGRVEENHRHGCCFLRGSICLPGKQFWERKKLFYLCQNVRRRVK